jgi:uncharacterized protein
MPEGSPPPVPATDPGPAGVRTRYGIRIPTDEPGVTLAADLFLPPGSAPVPVLVSVLPYRRDAFAGIGGHASYSWFAAHGYASLLVDFRGTGSSDGSPRPPFDPAEADDGVAAVRWAARQPWCDGTVGMWGVSYGAVMALRTASRRPPELKAILTVVGMQDPERDLVHPSGSRGCLAPLGVWAMNTLLGQLLPPMHEHGSAEEQRRWRRRLDEAEPYLLDLLRHGPGHPVWRERAVDVAAVEVPTLCVAGWRDLLCEGSIRAYEQLRAPKRLLAGPWMHTPPHESPFEPVDFHRIALDWWDRWLRGQPAAGAEPAATVFVQGAEPGWRRLESWPPVGKELVLGATPAGGLAPADGTGPAEVALAAQPDQTVGALSGLWSAPTTGFGLPLDQHDDDGRGLPLTGPPLAAPLLVAGRPLATVRVPPGRPPARLVAKLADVDPAGRSTLVSCGVASTGDGPEWTVTLTPTCYRFAAGHRVRLVLSDADFPRLWPATTGLPLAVSGVELTLPALAEQDCEPAVLPAPEGPPARHTSLGLLDRPRWEITRDLVHSGVTVTVGEEVAAFTPQDGHLLQLSSSIAATVRDGAPGAARVRGESTATARLRSGEKVVVQVDLHVAGGAAAATGSVRVDGVEVYSGRWTATPESGTTAGTTGTAPPVPRPLGTAAVEPDPVEGAA